MVFWLTFLAGLCWPQGSKMQYFQARTKWIEEERKQRQSLLCLLLVFLTPKQRISVEDEEKWLTDSRQSVAVKGSTLCIRKSRGNE